MQEDKGLSIPAQRKAIDEYATAHEVPILETYVEAASSYQDEAKRIEFQRMFERAKSDPQVAMVLVHESSRFCRHPWRTPQLIGELQDAGVRVVSVTEPEYDVNTVMGMWMQKVMEAKNASYSMEVAFHTRKGMRQNAHVRDPESGWCCKNGGKPPWGYLTVRREGTDIRGRPRFKAVWDLDSNEVAGRATWEWTREVLVRAGEGASLDSLRDMLNGTGVPSPRGGYEYTPLAPGAAHAAPVRGPWHVGGAEEATAVERADRLGGRAKRPSRRHHRGAGEAYRAGARAGKREAQQSVGAHGSGEVVTQPVHVLRRQVPLWTMRGADGRRDQQRQELLRLWHGDLPERDRVRHWSARAEGVTRGQDLGGGT
jgi:hypothetical protein